MQTSAAPQATVSASGSFVPATRVRRTRDWLGLKRDPPHWLRVALIVCSFLLPIGLWCFISYHPTFWKPKMKVVSTGSSEDLMTDQELNIADYNDAVKSLQDLAAQQKAEALAAGETPEELVMPTAYRKNPYYLPAPHEVARAFYMAFVTPPAFQGEPWLHESLGRSIATIMWAFFVSSLIGVPLGILCGTYRSFSYLQEPFIEFFRYLPAPAFGTLCVAILGLNDAPKIAIVFIGTFFQQVLVIGNTVRKVDPSLIEAAQTLGARGWKLVTKVIVPASITDIYTDLRILLGWAWTYLIVAEVVGTSSGITFFISTQGKHQNYANVYAAIIMIGIIGFVSDVLLAALGKVIFPWKRKSRPSTTHTGPLATLAPPVAAHA